jgi:hypothetical protein
MSFLNNIGKTLTQSIDRAKFEAEKFQKVSRVQGELSDLRRQIDLRRIELGDRAFELYKAGQITSVTLGEIIKAIEALRAGITLKEEELKAAQAEGFVEPVTPPSSTPAQHVPVSVDPPTHTPTSPNTQAPQYTAPATQTPPAPTAGLPQQATGTKTCPNCSFNMPITALFCPSCGTRVGA